MGISTDAILLYGVCLGGQEDWDGEGAHPLEAACKAIGAETPPEGHDPADWDYDYELGKMLPKPLEVVMTGHSSGCPKWFLAAVHVTAHRGYEHEFTKGLPEVSEKAEEKLAEAVKKLDCGSPRWWLASYADF